MQVKGYAPQTEHAEATLRLDILEWSLFRVEGA